MVSDPQLQRTGHTQWFYFAVAGADTRPEPYTFTILNLEKGDSLYNYGMLPLFYSTASYEAEGVGWLRKGEDLHYYKATALIPFERAHALAIGCMHNIFGYRLYTFSCQAEERRTGKRGYYYHLTFSLTFEHEHDLCFVAHCYPYTQLDLHRDITKWMATGYCVLGRLCLSLGGAPVDMITVTSPDCTPEEKQTKRVAVFSGRVHPGETNGSWMVRGLLDFLTGESDEVRRFFFFFFACAQPDRDH